VNVIETHVLSKSYGHKRALFDCTLAIPEGHVTALVGPNGAGKTTLLNLVVGLAVPTSGAVTVLGGRPAGSLAALDGIAFVAQNTPLYKNLSARDLLHETCNLNHRFDQGFAERRLGELGIPLRQRAGEMSGGQQAQLALTLALARLPQLLVLDEPLANLDPIAREDFMATVMTAVAEDGVSVVLSSHVLAELERVADYLVLVTHGDIQLAGEVEALLATYRMLTGPATESERLGRQWNVVHASRSATEDSLLVRRDSTANPVPPGWEERAVTLEELTMAYLRESGAATSSRATRSSGEESSAVTK
jgi:ABC-2 type transport system ATP-binding protein